MPKLNSSLREWSAVAAHTQHMAGAHLRDLTAADALRWQIAQMRAGNVLGMRGNRAPFAQRGIQLCHGEGFTLRI